MHARIGTDQRLSTFSDVIQARAAARAEAVAYRFLAEGEEQELALTYAQAAHRAKKVAAALREAGCAGERVLLLYPPGLDYVVAMLGCLCSGAVAVPAYPPRATKSRANDRIISIIKDARPAAVLTTSKLLQSVQESVAESGVRCIATDGLDEQLAYAWREPNIRPYDLACLQYTSGSTAAPKGVMLTHANLMHNSAVVCEAFGHKPGMTGVIWLPPYHDMGLGGGILQPLFGGGSVVLMAPATFLQKPVRWLHAISKYKAATSGGPNFAYELCAKTISEQDKAGLDLSCWNVAFNGAEPIDPATLDRFSRAFAPCGFLREAFYPCYGLAEATLMVSGPNRMCEPALDSPEISPGNKAGGPFVGCGKARDDGKIVIVDPQTLRLCPPGVVGEIWVSGSSVARGYWDNPTDTEQTFKARLSSTNEGPFLRTGDLGFYRREQLFVTGRLKDLINLRGVKHYPQDIERTAQDSHPALQPAGAAAFSIAREGEEKLVVLQEIQRSQRNSDPEQIIAAIREAISKHHEVDVYAIVLLKPGQLPKTSSGKVQHFACRDGYLSGTFEVLAEWKQAPAARVDGGPRDGESLESWMTRKLAGAVGVAPAEIDPTEPFARYGLDSVKAASIASDIAAHLGREIPLMLFWDYPSITALARHLSKPAES
jgi:acyl-CoA synthetase (AMP-forming)/AMP-acid ligase II/acyl carrier protein